MGHSFAHLMAEHKPAPLKVIARGECPDCRTPMLEHYAPNSLEYLGCPREQTALVEHLDALLRGAVMAFGAFGTEALIDHIEQVGLVAVRARLVALLAKGGR